MVALLIHTNWVAFMEQPWPCLVSQIAIQQTPYNLNRRLNYESRAIESKVGRTSASKQTRRQVAKDAEILNDATTNVNKVVWEFTPGPVTGNGGPTGPLRKLLEDSGIDIIEN